MSKIFLPEHKSYSVSTAHKQFTINTASSGESIRSTGAIAVAFNSGSSNEVSRSYYHSINSLFYKPQFFGGNSNFSGKGTYLTHAHLSPYNPTHKNKFNNNGVIFSISSSKYGRTV